MREIENQLEKELTDLAIKKFKKGETYKNSSESVGEDLGKRYSSWIVDRYKRTCDVRRKIFYEDFKLK